MIWRGRNDDPGGEEERRQGSMPEQQPGQDQVQGNSVGTRIESIVEAAERAASGIRADAEERARRYLDESKRRADELASQRVREMSELTDTLIERARAVAARSDQLIAALEEAGRQVTGRDRPVAAEPGSDPYRVDPGEAAEAVPPQPSRLNSAPEWSRSAPQQPAEPPPPAPPPAPQPAPPPEPPRAQPPPAPAPQVSEGARLLATQMAVAGSSREDIARRLRDEFGIDDTSAILDQIGV